MSYTLEEKTHRDCKNDPSKSEYFKKITIVSTQQDRSETQPEVEFHSSGAQWDALYEVANAQAGLFAIDQAQAIGFSDQLLSKHARGGRLERLHRGIYRITRLPPHEHEEYVFAWLWSGRRGVISHESALLLHGLSDALPSRIHLTLPGARAEFHTKVPETFIVHFGEVPEAERAWLGAVPLTRPARTINDVARDHGDAILVEQAIEQGIRRGALSRPRRGPGDGVYGFAWDAWYADLSRGGGGPGGDVGASWLSGPICRRARRGLAGPDRGDRRGFWGAGVQPGALSTEPGGVAGDRVSTARAR